jgi:hypothetical protein
MVHALQTIHALLKPDGCLLDLRPQGTPAEFGVRTGSGWQVLGHIEETDGFVEYGQAAEAVAQVLDAGLFSMEATGEYDYLIYADSLGELKRYLVAEWSDAVIPPGVLAQAEALRPAQISLRDFIYAGLMRLLSK